jgi:hypothetical protein
MTALNNDAKTSSVTRAWLDLEVLHNAPMLRSSWLLQIPSKGGDDKENTRNMVSGVTHLRPTLFAEWIMYMAGAIRDKKILPLGFGDARYAPVAGEDLGRVIAAILKDPVQHAGKTYSLYGPHELSQYEIADMLTQVLGNRITYIPMEIEAFKTLLKEL